MYPSKNVILCLKTGQSPKKSYWMSIPSLTAAAFSPTSRWGVGWQWGAGGKPLDRAKTRPFICRLPALQTSEHFLPFTKDVGF
jgi:hypothetical protein